MKKVIRLTEQDVEKLIRKIIKEDSNPMSEDYMAKKPDLLKFVLKVMLDNKLVSPSNVNVYDNNFEVYGFEGRNFGYFMDNHIIFEKGGESEVFLNFEMYEEDIDMVEALEVADWLYPKLYKLFNDEIIFMDNLDDEL